MANLLGRQEITYKDLFEGYVDLENTYLLEELIEEGKATDTTVVCINETTESDLDENGKLFDTSGTAPWLYIPGKTFTLSDTTNTFTLGYVYTSFDTYTFEGKKYIALQDPYIDNYGTDGDVVYKAPVIDEDGYEYIMMWDTLEEFDESGELAALESYSDLSEEQKERMQELEEKGVYSGLCEDESNACDWDNPVSVTLV